MAQGRSIPLGRFANEHGLDLSSLQGKPYPNKGGRSGFSSETYAIEAGSLHHSEPDRPVSEKLTAVRLTSCKRFANSLLQLTHASMVADSLGIKRLHIPGFWYLKEGIGYSTTGLEIRNTSAVDLTSDDMVLAGSFLKMRVLKPLCHGHVNPRKSLRKLRPLLKIDINGEPYSKHDLVIHIRSGDIFTNPHPGYGQPPLSFYKKVVQSRRWDTVRIVFENRLNPVITPFLEWLPDNCGKIIPISSELSDDIDVLLRARHIACGNGTFIPGISALSRNLKTVHHWRHAPFNSWGNRRLRVFSVIDGLGQYNDAICKNNWANTDEQQRLMVEYPEDELVIQGPVKGL